MRAAVQPLGVPGVQRAQLVDRPALSPLGRQVVVAAGRRVPEAVGFVDALVQQQFQVIEQKLAPVGQ
mgnify:CR=1 FL=1